MRRVATEEFRLRSLYGLTELAKTVGATMGTCGGNVMFHFSDQNFGLTKDGVTVAKGFFITNDAVAHAVSTYMKEAAEQTNKEAGDGTTTATILGATLYAAGLTLVGEFPSNVDFHSILPSYLLNDVNGARIFNWEKYDNFEPIAIPYLTTWSDFGYSRKKFTEFIDIYCNNICNRLDEMAKEISLTPQEIVKSVAYVSSNGDKVMQDLFVEAFEKVQMDGIVLASTVVRGKNEVTSIEGFNFEGQPEHPGFLNPNTYSVEFEKPLIFISDKYTDLHNDVQTVLSHAKTQNRPFVLIAAGLGESLLNQVVHTMHRDGIKGIVVKAPAFGIERNELLHDIAAVTGGTFLDSEAFSLATAKLHHAGTCDKVIVNMNGTSLVGFDGSEKIRSNINERIAALENRLKDKNLGKIEIEKLNQRISNLKGHFAEIIYSVDSEPEQEEAKYRLEDALNAIYTALKEGVVAGGGTALIEAGRSELLQAEEAVATLEDEALDEAELYKEFASVMASALMSPLHTLLENANVDSYFWIDKILESLTNGEKHMGVELQTMQFKNLVECRVLDPVNVTKSALRSAVSVAKTLVSTVMMQVNE